MKILDFGLAKLSREAPVSQDAGASRLSVFDTRDGSRRASLASQEAALYPAISPDGRRLPRRGLRVLIADEAALQQRNSHRPEVAGTHLPVLRIRIAAARRGVSPILGRRFGPEEQQPGGPASRAFTLDDDGAHDAIHTGREEEASVLRSSWEQTARGQQ